MTVLIIAASAGGITWLGFYLLDRRTKTGGFTKKPAIKDQKNVSKTDMVDYSIYEMSINECVISIGMASIFLYVLGFIFYQNHIVSTVFALLGIFYLKIRKKQLISKRKHELSLQFKQALYSLSSSLAAGKSVENSFSAVIYDMRLLYTNPDTYVIQEFELMNRKIENGETIENALLDFSKRAAMEDITNFTDVFITCKRTGGDLVAVIRRTSSIISDKLETEQEISVMLAQKRFESKVLSIVPIVIVAVLSFSSPDYMDPLYQTRHGGPIIMSVALILLGLCFWITRQIMNIKA